jgi:hypothetical protein
VVTSEKHSFHSVERSNETKYLIGLTKKEMKIDFRWEVTCFSVPRENKKSEHLIEKEYLNIN